MPRALNRKWWAIAASMIVIGVCVAAADPAQYLGTWSGSWEGGGSGRFDLTFERGADGQITGGVSVGTDQGDYTAKFKELAFDGNQMKAKYDFPLDSQAEVAVTGTFGADAAEGGWSLLPKGQETAFAGGTWKVAKK